MFHEPNTVQCTAHSLPSFNSRTISSLELTNNDTSTEHGYGLDYRPYDPQPQVPNPLPPDTSPCDYEHFKSPFPISFQIEESDENSTYFGLTEIFRRLTSSPLAWDNSQVPPFNPNWEIQTKTYGQDPNIWVLDRQIKHFAICESAPETAYILTMATGNNGEFNPEFSWISHIFKTNNFLNGEMGDCSETNTEDLTCNLLRDMHDVDDIFDAPCYLTEENEDMQPYFRVFSGIAVSHSNPNKVWVTYTGYDDFSKVWFSSDGGYNWVNADPTGSLNNLPINDIVYQDGTDDRIFIATDAGVYYKDNSMSEWKRYGTMPNVRVSEIGIQRCSNKIFCSTLGRGLWEAELPPMTTYTSELIIDENTVFTEEKDMSRNIRILPGATLRVEADLYMPHSGRIVVEKGAKLVVDNAKISNRCDAMWLGIEVWGDANLSQTPTNQGVVDLINATIENAHTGVWVRKNDADCNEVFASGGGIVRANHSLFRNCYVGVEFAPYIHINNNIIVPNKSYFKFTQFVTDDLLNKINDQHPFPKAGVIMRDNFRINFDACTFTNTAVLNEDDQIVGLYDSLNKRGRGIVAYSSVFEVRSACDTPVPLPEGTPCPDDLSPCTFSNLEYGILALSATGTDLFKCDGAEFTNNYVGIRAEGMWEDFPPVVQDCDFELNPLFDLHPGDFIVGIDLDGILNYTIKHNRFNSSQTTPLSTIGIGLTSTRNYSKEIYANEFDNLAYGIIAQGRNGTEIDENEPQGTQILCNKFGEVDYNNFDVFLNVPYGNWSTTLSSNQGGYDDLILSQASNLFSGDCLNTFCNWDINGINPSSSSIDYWTAENDTEIQYYTTGVNGPEVVVHYEAGEPFNYSASCPSRLNSNLDIELHAKLALTKSQLTETIDVFYDRLDNGSTFNQVAFINNVQNTSLEVRNAMLTAAPYLSKDAWLALFNRQPAMNPWHMAQILLACSPLKQPIIDMMYQYNLDPFYLELVMNGQNGSMTSKDILQNDISSLSLLKQRYKSDVLRNVYFADTLGSDWTVLLSTISDEADDFTIPGQLALNQRLGNTAAFNLLLSDCENNDDCDLFSEIHDALAAGTVCRQLPSEIEDDLLLLANNDNNLGSRLYRALLADWANEEWPVDIHPLPQFRNAQFSIDTESQLTGIAEVSPNPADLEVYIKYALPSEIESSKLTIFDTQGIQIDEFVLSQSRGVQTIQVGKWASGLYIYRLASEGIMLESGKFNVIH